MLKKKKTRKKFVIPQKIRDEFQTIQCNWLDDLNIFFRNLSPEHILTLRNEIEAYSDTNCWWVYYDARSILRDSIDRVIRARGLM